VFYISPGIVAGATGSWADVLHFPRHSGRGYW